jgi:hypothetical protein
MGSIHKEERKKQSLMDFVEVEVEEKRRRSSSVECPSIDTAGRHKKISQKWAPVGQTTVAAANAHLHTSVYNPATSPKEHLTSPRG